MQPKTRLTTKYDELHDWQLQDLMMDRGIKPPPRIENGVRVYRQPEREWIIAALVKQDTQPAPPLSQSTTFNVYDSNFINQSPGASISAENIDLKSEEFRNLVEGIKQLAQDEQLSPEARTQIGVDIATVELQLNSPQPKVGVIKESMLSVKGVLDNATGSLIAAGVIAAIKYFFG
jgi:hypothetical protein